MSKYIRILDYEHSFLTSAISVLVACDSLATYDNITSKDVSSEDLRDSGVLSYMDLESRIARALLTPVYANGDLLLKDLDEYIKRLDKILDAFLLSKPQQRKFARMQMELIGKYGPKVYHLTWPKEHLMEIYKWDESQLNKVYDGLNNIECLWDSVRTYMKCIYDDSVPLAVLDERIINGMTNPVKDKGEDLLSDAYNYYNILDDIETLVKDKDAQGIERLENLIKEGGPKFVNATMAEDDMRYIFKWDPSEFNELRATMEGTKIIWERLLKRLNKIKMKGTETKNTSSDERDDV